jgi:hypothetical protein
MSSASNGVRLHRPLRSAWFWAGGIACVAIPVTLHILLVPGISPIEDRPDLAERAAQLEALASSGDRSPIQETPPGCRGSGRSVATSPDGQYVAYLQAAPELLGFLPSMGEYDLFLRNEADQGSERLLTVTEQDPGSGRSYTCVWSEDSEALFVYGWGQVKGYDSPQSRLKLMYLVDEGRWYGASRAP